MQDTLDAVGDVQSFVQQGEDVTDQLTDLDTRITNQRASVARIRELHATATDVEAIVRIEGELTNRETALEQLLAMQASLQGRVAMSTLTIDITETPAAAATTDEGDDDGTTIGDALGAGWSAFAGALFAIALVLTAAMPFLLLTPASAWSSGSCCAGCVERGAAAGQPRDAEDAEREEPSPAVRGEHPVGDRAVGERERSPHPGVGEGLGHGGRSERVAPAVPAARRHLGPAAAGRRPARSSPWTTPS